MHIYLKLKKFIFSIYKIFFVFVKYKNDKSNLSLNELKLIGQIRNISDYENKSKEDLIKALNETKPKTLKPETPKTYLKQNQKQHQNKQ